MTEIYPTDSLTRIYVDTLAMELLRAERRQRNRWPSQTIIHSEVGTDPLTLAGCYAAAVSYLLADLDVTRSSVYARIVQHAAERTGSCPICLSSPKYLDGGDIQHEAWCRASTS